MKFNEIVHLAQCSWTLGFNHMKRVLLIRSLMGSQAIASLFCTVADVTRGYPKHGDAQITVTSVPIYIYLGGESHCDWLRTQKFVSYKQPLQTMPPTRILSIKTVD